MRSEFLLGLVGLLIVWTVLIGGMMMASLCHHLLTPNLGFCYVIWLWLWLIPCWWIVTATLALEPFPQPVATYVAFLPFLVLVGLLIDRLGPRNLWAWLAIAASIYTYQAVVALFRRAYQVK